MADNGKIPAEIMPEGGAVSGVVRFLDQSSRLDKELLSARNSIQEASTAGVFKDNNERNKVTRYLSRLWMCHNTEAIDVLIFWLNASIAVGGHQRDEALMANAKLWVPEGGRKMDKKQMMKFLDNQAAQRAERNNNNNQSNQQKEE